MKIYGDRQSGNCYKIILAANLLNIQFDWIEVDILKGETSTPEFLQKNPNGKIPLMELPNGETLSESNAILNYLCEGSAFYPADIWTRAKIHQWQFFEQYSHEPYIAVARFINKYLGLPEDRKQDYLAKQEGGKKALTVMEQQLGKSSFLTGDFPSAADISLFAYTHVANEGGFNLRDYPNIQTWIKRMQNLRNFVSM